MKKIVLILVLVSCTSQKRIFNSVVYNAATRGHNTLIEITNKNVLVKKNGSKQEFKITKQQLEKITAIISKLNLEEVPTLKAPSQDRFFDGAMTTTVSIAVGKKTYVSQAFDHNNPPVKIEELVKEIQGMLKEK